MNKTNINKLAERALVDRGADRPTYDDLFYEAELSLAILADNLQDDGLADMSAETEKLNDALAAMLRAMMEGD